MTAEMTKELIPLLKELHLPTVREYYQECADVARRETLSYEQYLFDVIQRECEVPVSYTHLTLPTN